MIVIQKDHIFYQPELIHGATYLSKGESRHCTKVLRLKKNDIITLVDGYGTFYNARISLSDAKKCEFEILEKELEKPRPHHIHIAIAGTKNADRMEWFVEKSVELGIDEVSFLLAEHSERKKINIDRIQKKAIGALKQSQKSSLPVINQMIRLNQFIKKSFHATEKFIAYVDQNIPKHLKEAAHRHKNYLILIGPEGDFSTFEIYLAKENGFIPVNLGKSRLRTETAGLVACHTLNLINDF